MGFFYKLALMIGSGYLIGLCLFMMIYQAEVLKAALLGPLIVHMVVILVIIRVLASVDKWHQNRCRHCGREL